MWCHVGPNRKQDKSFPSDHEAVLLGDLSWVMLWRSVEDSLVFHREVLHNVRKGKRVLYLAHELWKMISSLINSKYHWGLSMRQEGITTVASTVLPHTAWMARCCRPFSSWQWQMCVCWFKTSGIKDVLFCPSVVLKHPSSINPASGRQMWDPKSYSWCLQRHCFILCSLCAFKDTRPPQKPNFLLISGYSPKFLFILFGRYVDQRKMIELYSDSQRKWGNIIAVEKPKYAFEIFLEVLVKYQYSSSVPSYLKGIDWTL